MKKEEAMLIAKKRSKLLIEYITKILSDEKIVNGEIIIDAIKIDGDKMCVLELNLPSENFFNSLNTGIKAQQIDVLTEQILDDLIDNFIESETIGITKYYSIFGMMGSSIFSVDIINNSGSKLKINFLYRGQLFLEQIKKYNGRLNEYAKKQQENSNKLK